MSWLSKAVKKNKKKIAAVVNPAGIGMSKKNAPVTAKVLNPGGLGIINKGQSITSAALQVIDPGVGTLLKNVGKKAAQGNSKAGKALRILDPSGIFRYDKKAQARAVDKWKGGIAGAVGVQAGGQYNALTDLEAQNMSLTEELYAPETSEYLNGLFPDAAGPEGRPGNSDVMQFINKGNNLYYVLGAIGILIFLLMRRS